MLNEICLYDVLFWDAHSCQKICTNLHKLSQSLCVVMRKLRLTLCFSAVRWRGFWEMGGAGRVQEGHRPAVSCRPPRVWPSSAPAPPAAHTPAWSHWSLEMIQTQTNYIWKRAFLVTTHLHIHSNSHRLFELLRSCEAISRPFSHDHFMFSGKRHENE